MTSSIPVKPIHLNLAIGVAAFSGATAARMQLSLFALSLGAQPSQVGLLFATHFVFPLLMAWPIGVMADRIGSRGLLMFGMAAGAIGLSIPWAFPNLYALYAAGLMSGLAFAFSSVLILNLAGLLSTPENRARNFANTSMTGSTANVLGPLIAGFATRHGADERQLRHFAARQKFLQLHRCFHARQPRRAALLDGFDRHLLPFQYFG